jgi:hypothetical protein
MLAIVPESGRSFNVGQIQLFVKLLRAFAHTLRWLRSACGRIWRRAALALEAIAAIKVYRFLAQRAFNSNANFRSQIS